MPPTPPRRGRADTSILRPYLRRESAGPLRCVCAGLWRTDDGRWDAERREDGAWVLREYVEGEPVVHHLGRPGRDWPTLRAAQEYIR